MKLRKGRINLEMADPIFGPSSAQAALAPITVSPSGLSCGAELYLTADGGATKAATSGLVPFTSTGASQSIRLPVTMPADGVEYEVYLDVYADGMLITAYVATESVIIPSATVAPITWE